MHEKKWKKGLGLRGQLFSTDALLAFVIFAFVVVLISGLTNQLENQFTASTAQEYNRLAATRVAESLLASPGDPAYWNTVSDKNFVYRVGLVTNSNEIAPLKWSALQDWNATDYNSLKRVLGISNKSFYLTLVDVNRITLSRAGTAPIDVNDVAVVMLPAVYQGQPIMMNLQVYTP